MTSRRRRMMRWIVGGVVVIVVLAVAGPFVYIHLIEGAAPSKLSLSTSSPASSRHGAKETATGSLDIDGTWKVSSGSIAGYRVQEVLIGQHATAVGRTTRISGAITVRATTLLAASFAVDMASVKSDQSQRNAQFDGRIMDVTAYPTATFVLSRPIDLGAVPAIEVIAHARAHGTLTMHGVTRAVTVPLSYERTRGAVEVLADLDIVFSRWHIANPSIGGFVTTADQGTLEVLLRLSRGRANAPVTRASSSAGAGSAQFGGGAPVTVPATTVPKLSLHHAS